MKTPKKTKVRKVSVWIERIIRNDKGQITAVDLHDEETGYAVYCERTGTHYHGKFGTKK